MDIIQNKRPCLFHYVSNLFRMIDRTFFRIMIFVRLTNLVRLDQQVILNFRGRGVTECFQFPRPVLSGTSVFRISEYIIDYYT